MLSFNDGDDVVGKFKAYHNKQNKLVFLNNEKKKYSTKEKMELLRLEYGYKARRFTSIDRLEQHWDKLEVPNVRGHFIPLLINPENRVVHYISGRSGSGKSTLARDLAEEYSKLYKCYLVAPYEDKTFKMCKMLDINELVNTGKVKESDYEEQKKEYDKMKVNFKYKKKEIDDPEVLKELEKTLIEIKPSAGKQKKSTNLYFTEYYYNIIKKPTLFVYDDTETLPDQDKLKFLISDQLLTGRKKHINIIYISHLNNKGSDPFNRNMLNESHVFTIFPPFTHYVDYFLHKYMQLNKRMINLCKELMSSSPHDYCSIYPHQQIILSRHIIYKY